MSFALAQDHGAARPGEMKLWTFAAVLALAFHLSLGLGAVWLMRGEEFEDETGAPAIEMAMDFAAPKTEQTDLPPGPESEASAAAPESAQSAKKTEAVEKPVVEQDMTEDPDRVVAPEKPEKPQRDEDKPQAQQSQASAASVAAEATAAPKLDAAAEAPVARAPSLGAGQAAAQVRAAWHKRLFAHLSRHKRYPAGVAQRQAENRVVFTLDRSGRVVSARIAASSGDPAFDAASLEMMRKADPVPAPPPLVADETLTFEIPVAFRAPGR